MALAVKDAQVELANAKASLAIKDAENARLQSDRAARKELDARRTVSALKQRDRAALKDQEIASLRAQLRALAMKKAGSVKFITYADKPNPALAVEKLADGTLIARRV